jgi:predicted DNA-binding transcriptional regulator AlpA
MVEDLLSERDLSQKIQRSCSSLQKDRLTGEGPPFIPLGRLVRYRASEVEAWLSVWLGPFSYWLILARKAGRSRSLRR